MQQIALMPEVAYPRPSLRDRFFHTLLWLLLRTFYRLRAIGQEHMPFHGPALLVCNHVSFVDGLLLSAGLPRMPRFLVHQKYYEHPCLYWLMRLLRMIPIAGGCRTLVGTAFAQAREALQRGEMVCIFAEGAISRTGNILPFKRGLERLMDGVQAPIVPVHLHCVWGSVLRAPGGRSFWERLPRLLSAVTVSFGSPQPATATAGQIRQAIVELGSAAAEDHSRRQSGLLHGRFLATAKRQWERFCMADTTGRRLTFGAALIASILLAGWLRKRHPHDAKVGLLLPATVGGALANMATLLAGKVPVNLNYTAGQEVMEAAIEQCDIRTILTSKRFVRQAGVQVRPGMVYMEEIFLQISSWQKILVAVMARLFPVRWLQRVYAVSGEASDALATVIFSSGSTGMPKGVMLSHRNILSNIESMQQVFPLTTGDCMLGILPFFHAFGFTVTLCFPLTSGYGVVYHPNPLEARAVGHLARTYGVTMLVSTPTFCELYLRQCPATDFATLRYAMVGAEALRPQLAHAFHVKYGVQLLEGYGCTEMSPVVAVNVPDVGQGSQRQIGHKPGTVGHALPGIAAQVVHPETGEPLPAGAEGLLLVRGPNRMLGYLGQAEKTAEVLRDGWYVTGDIAAIDEDGFIRLVDRLARFSKIGGEMVPHQRIEEAIHTLLGEEACVVTAIPDDRKGEALVVLYTRMDMAPQTLWQKLLQTDLPRLWLPKREHYFLVEALPRLATGKMDLQRARRLAIDQARAARTDRPDIPASQSGTGGTPSAGLG